MTTGHVHVIGAGLAGLAAAVTLAARGARVSVHEAGDHAGGRCRSYDDAALGSEPAMPCLSSSSRGR